MAERLDESLRVTLKAANNIKLTALQDRLFRHFCEDSDEDFTRSLLHTEVWWLSQGNCFHRLDDLWDTFVIFFSSQQTKNEPFPLNAIFFVSVIFVQSLTC